MKTDSRRAWMWAAVLAVSLGATAAYAAPAAKHKRAASKVQIAGVVNLNQATAAQLDLLPGVGAKAAQAIVAYRSQHPFSRPEELVKVKGFGKKRFEKLKSHLATQGPTTLKQVAAVAKTGVAAHPS